MSNYNSFEIKNNRILNIYKLLILIFPALIVGGNLFSNGVVVLSIPIFFYLIFKKKNSNLFWISETKLLLLVFLFFLISSLISKNFYSIEYSIRYLRFFTFILIIFYFLCIDEKFEKKFLKFFNLLFFVLLVDSFYQYLNGSNILGIENKVIHRISGLFGDELILGSFISKYIFVCFVYFFYFKKDSKLIFTIFLIGLIILTYISGERVAFFSIIIFSIISLIKFSKIKYVLIFSSIVIVILTAITFKDPNIRQRMINDTMYQTKFLQEWKNPKKILFYSDDHNAHYQSAYLMFKKGNLQYKFFGRGFKSFRTNCSKKEFCDTPGGCCSTHPHNVFFQIISELGLIGFAIYLYFYLTLTKNLFLTFTNKINKPKFFLINLALFVNLLPIVPSGNIFSSFMSFNFAILISYYIYLNKNE